MGSVGWIAYLGMGGNLPWNGRLPEQTLHDAVRAISELGTMEAVSGLWRTAPVGPVRGQPDFVNAAGKLRTKFAPLDLLEQMLAVEGRFGRVRGAVGKGPRTLDLDLLLMEDAASGEPVVLREPHLRLPHSEMHRRRFVLAPLAEIAPEARHPLLGVTVRDLLTRLPDGLPLDGEKQEQVVRIGDMASA